MFTNEQKDFVYICLCSRNVKNVIDIWSETGTMTYRARHLPTDWATVEQVALLSFLGTINLTTADFAVQFECTVCGFSVVQVMKDGRSRLSSFFVLHQFPCRFILFRLVASRMKRFLWYPQSH